MSEDRIQAMARYVLETLGEDKVRELMQPLVDWVKANKRAIETISRTIQEIQEARSMIQDDKYHVLKGTELLEPGDYFVLRRGDILAISTLRSYANNALTLLELERMGLVHYDKEQRKHLLGLVDYASSLADNWEQGDTELPD